MGHIAKLVLAVSLLLNVTLFYGAFQKDSTVQRLSTSNGRLDTQIDKLVEDYNYLETYSYALAVQLGQLKKQCGIVDGTEDPHN